MDPKNSELINEMERFFRPFKVLFDPSKEKEVFDLIERFAKNIGAIIFKARDQEDLIGCFDVAIECADFEKFFKNFEELTLAPGDKNPLGKPLEFFQNPAVPNAIDRHLLDATGVLAGMLAIAAMPGQAQVEPWLAIELARRVARGFRACTAILVFLEKEIPEGVIPQEIRIDRKEMEAMFEEIKEAIEEANLDG